jgi:hypothetical protein
MPYDRMTVAELLDALGERTPSPASGAAIAVTGALAAVPFEVSTSDDAPSVLALDELCPCGVSDGW